MAVIVRYNYRAARPCSPGRAPDRSKGNGVTSTRLSSPARRRPRSLRAGLLGAALLVALTGCSWEEVARFGYLEPVTPQGESILNLYVGSSIAGLVVGVVVWGLIFYACIRYRKRTDELPRQVRYNLPVEVLYTVVPFVVIAVLFYYTAVSETFVNDLSEEDEGGPDLVVGVVGFQWNWQFNYDQFRGQQFGEAGLQPLQVTGRPGAPAELVLPTNTTIRFVETSPDVVHSFWVPQFLFKRDVIPGRVNQFELTVEREGVYIGRCAEFCGVDHDRMNFQVRVVPPQQFDLFVRDSAAFYEQYAPDPRVVPGNQPFGTTAEAAADHGASTEHEHLTTTASAGSPS